jgi:hypothetical protein
VSGEVVHPAVDHIGDQARLTVPVVVGFGLGERRDELEVLDPLRQFL